MSKTGGKVSFTELKLGKVMCCIPPALPLTSIFSGNVYRENRIRDETLISEFRHIMGI